MLNIYFINTKMHRRVLHPM